MQKSQNTIILHQANDSLCNSHVYIYEHIFPLIEFICLHHVDHIANTCAEADFNWLWDTLLPCLRFCCYSRVVSLLQLYSNIVAILRLISGVHWSLIHVAAGHVTGDHLLHDCQIWNVGFVKVCQVFKGAITICCGCTTSVFQKSWFWKS